MADAVNHTFSSSNSLIEDLKKKIKAVKQELAIIASTVKDLSVSFPLIGQKEMEKKQLLLQLQSMQDHRKKLLRPFQCMSRCPTSLGNYCIKT